MTQSIEHAHGQSISPLTSQPDVGTWQLRLTNQRERPAEPDSGRILHRRLIGRRDLTEI